MGFRSELRRHARLLILAAVCVGLLAASSAARADSCREWTQEHWEIKSDVVRLYLTRAPQEPLDAAVFELLQREAYMTSCDPATVVDRVHQVGWRMVDRDPDDYAAAVIEGVLADSGMDLSLAGLFEVTDLEAPTVAPAQTASRTSTRRR